MAQSQGRRRQSNRLVIMRHQRLQITMLLITVALQLAATSMVASLQVIGQSQNNQQQQQNVISTTVVPLLTDPRQRPASDIPFAGGEEPSGTIKTEEAPNEQKQTSDTGETSSPIGQAAEESDLKRPDAHSFLHLLGSNELRTGPESITTKTGSNDLDISPVISRFQAHSVKSRRHANLFNVPVADWWTKMAPRPQPPHKGKSSPEPKDAGRQQTGDSAIAAVTTTTTTTSIEPSRQRRPESGTKHSSQSNGATTKTGFNVDPRSVYKEQPLNQNAILTIKNQLSAIKGKHKVLITRSMQQLQQLDNRLIESYRLCLKRKMPLYAGMLYRTRDFVARMAKEATHERKVLEAMTKQVHTVLRQKMINQTLVREYNRLVQAPAAATTTTTEGPSHVIALQQHQVGKSDNLHLFQSGTQSLRSTTNSQRTAGEDVMWQSANQEEPSTTAQRDTKSDPASANGLNEVSRTSFADKRDKFSHWPAIKKSPERESERPSTKAKQGKYSASVNEVNLKKELTKIQSLIDRINGSSYEITSVVDDIIYLFRLSEEPSLLRRGKPSSGNRLPTGQITEGQAAMMYSSSSDPKQMKKMLRAPIKIFLEKYGKLANLKSMNDEFNRTSSSGDNSDITNMNMQEIKPLFEPSSLVYSELKDPDIGFD